ncbi:transcription factor TFIIIB component B'' homolog isoform X4 [Parambassis ranga]|uniref:Transcription factor TFIIIB component B'' homolog isoform X4 n=1 Tax=Parambassis ranga TaxID=210632 RepID=A0A6P7J8J3_9TELE|nr:transcription factor TFIIIB component B'' homolog isoform X4 [Parambassis ranga]
MFRRSRFSVRPNVGTAGRAAAAAPPETPSASQESSETPKDASESINAAPVTDNKSDVTPSEKALAGDGNDNTSAAVQRRKRFSIKPKVAPGRTSNPSRTPKSPLKAVSEKHLETSGSDVDKPTTSRQPGPTPAPQGLQSPRRRRLSGDASKQLTMHPKPNSTSSESSGASALTPAGDSVEQTQQSAESSKQLENISSSQVKQILPRAPDKVPPSLPDKEAIEISEKAKTLVSSKNLVSLTPSAMSLSRLLNDPSDLQRLVKAQKLRELLRQERQKEMKRKKAKGRPKEYTLDPTKMTMRDLIHYLPTSNPMPSSLEESAQENETVVPPSPVRAESPERAQEPEDPPNTAATRENEDEEEEQDEALMVPQVKVAEDGSLIIDEESLTVEVQRAKGPNPAHDRDPIFERGSTTTYSSFRKGTYSKPWSSEETDMFFLAISMVGTDFSMICQLFPHRARSEIKNKFKKEERENTWRIDKAFRERRKLDIEFFSKLLEKILEVQKNRKKLKSLTDKNSTKKRQRKAKGKKKLSDVEEEDDEDENQAPDLEKKGEKEEEDPAAAPKKKRKRKDKNEALTKEPNEKKKKTSETGNDQGEASIPEDSDAVLPADHTDPDMSEKTQNETTAKDAVIKPAKLSRGRAPKPLVPLGRKWGKKTAPAAKAQDADNKEESVGDGASKERENEDATQKKSVSDDDEEEEEDATVKPPKPTRYGRVPKPTNSLTYPAKEDASASASDSTSASGSEAKPKPKCTAKRGGTSKQQPAPVSKKPKLVTLRASQSESSDGEEQQYACSSDSTLFGPASLHTSQPVSDVDYSVVELDILASMPDVLGISQDALCPDSTCEQAQCETGTADPCEHQLDLLVDVIDLLSSEHTEVSEDESYNEAARTLLTIGNLAHLSQSAENQMAMQDHITGIQWGVNETSQLEDGISSKSAAQEESTPPPVAADQDVTHTSECVAAVELQGRISESRDNIKTSEQETDCDPKPAVESSSPQAKRGRMSKVKPKPNIGQSSRAAQLKPAPELSTVSTVPSQDHETIPAAGQATPKIPDCDTALVKDAIFCTEMKLTEEPTDSQEIFADQVEKGAAGQATPKIPDCDTALVKDDIFCTEMKLREEPTDSQEIFADQVEKGTAMLDSQNSSEIHSHCFSESQFELKGGQTTRDTNAEPTDEKSHFELVEPGFNIPTPSESAVLKLEHATRTDPFQESGNKPSSCVLPAEDPLIHQKKESEVTTGFQSRRSRFQKVKPKPNLPQASRTAECEPKEPEEKGLTLDPNIHQNEPHAASKPAEEPSVLKEEAACVGPVHEVDADAASVHGTSENQNFPEVQFAGASESSCKNMVTTDSAATESQAESNVDSAPVQENSSPVAALVTPVEELPLSQEGEVSFVSQVRRGRAQKMKPKPNLQQTSRTVRSKPQTTKDSTPDPQNPQQAKVEEEISTNQEKKTHVECVDQPVSDKSDQNVPEDQFESGSKRVTKKEELVVKDSKTKPCSPQSCGSASTPESTNSAKAERDKKQTPPEKPSQIKRTGPVPVPLAVPTLPYTSELPSTSEENTDVECGVVSSSEGSDPTLPQRRRRLPKVKPNIRSTRTALTKPHDIRTTSKHQPEDSAQTDVKLTLSDELTSQVLRSPVKASPASQADSRESTNSNNQPSGHPDVQSSKIKSVVTAAAISVCSEKDSSAQSADDARSEITDSPKTSKGACRGRFIKPKPNLGGKSRPLKPTQSTAPAESDMDTPVDDKPVPDLKPAIQGPAEEATNQDPSLNVAEVIKPQSQHDCPLTESIQSFPGIFTDMLPEQVPTDPDEPFFILSLTEIPVSSSEEMMDSTAEHLSYLPVTDTSVTPQSVSRAAGDASLSCVPVPMHTVKNDMTGPDPGSPAEVTVDPCAGSATVEPPKSAETEGNNKTEIPPIKQKITGTGRQAAKLQALTTTARTKQTRKPPAAEETDSTQTDSTQTDSTQTDSTQTDSTQDSEHPDGPHVAQETVAGGKDSDSSAAAKTTQSIRTSGRKRKPKDVPSKHSEINKTAPSSSPLPVKAASKGLKVKTKKAPQLAASVSQTVAPTQPPKKGAQSASTTSQRNLELSFSDPTPSTSQASVSDFVEHSVVDEEEEPTNVSQYFLTDIFTDVEEG